MRCVKINQALIISATQICRQWRDSCYYKTQGGGWEDECDPGVWGHCLQLNLCQDLMIKVIYLIVKLWYVDCLSHFQIGGFFWNVGERELYVVCRNSWAGKVPDIMSKMCLRCSSTSTMKTSWPCWRCASSGQQWLSVPSCGRSSGRWLKRSI